MAAMTHNHRGEYFHPPFPSEIQNSELSFDAGIFEARHGSHLICIGLMDSQVTETHLSRTSQGNH